MLSLVIYCESIQYCPAYCVSVGTLSLENSILLPHEKDLKKEINLTSNIIFWKQDSILWIVKKESCH